jgi:alpha-galactosidase
MPAIALMAVLAIGLLPLCAVEDTPIKKASKPLKIYVLAGQSNMQGKAKVRTIERLNLTEDSKLLYKDMMGADGNPATVKDVYGVYFTAGRNGPEVHMGPLNPTYGGEPDPERNFGPEYTFGIYLQQHLNEPFLIIKTAWGGKDLVRQFRSPSAGELPLSEAKVEKFKAEGTYEAELAKHKESTGEYYRMMINNVQEVLKDPGKYHPAYNQDVGYEIAGFVWFQGWNDLVNGFYKDSGEPMEKMYEPYSGLMAKFIHDVRKDFNTPAMPFVIGVLGVEGPKNADEKMYWFRKAQAAPAEMSEFKSNVKAVLTENYWDMEALRLSAKVEAAAWEKVKTDNPDIVSKPRAAEGLKAKYFKELLPTVLTPDELKLKTTGESNAGYHYNGSAYILGNIGKAFAEAMIELSNKAK